MMTTKRICTTECQFNIAQTNKTSWEVFFFTLLNFTKNFILLRHWCSQTQIKWIFMYFALKLQLFHVVFVPFFVVFLFIFLFFSYFLSFSISSVFFVVYSIGKKIVRAQSNRHKRWLIYLSDECYTEWFLFVSCVSFIFS